MSKKRGMLVLYTGSSGVGKGTIMKELLKRDPNIRLSVSNTTREPRKGEIDGVHYNFVTKEEFEKLIEADGYLEYAVYCDNYYGTPKKQVEDMLEQGFDVFLEIEVQGGLQVMKNTPIYSAYLFFLRRLKFLKKDSEKGRQRTMRQSKNG